MRALCLIGLVRNIGPRSTVSIEELSCRHRSNGLTAPALLSVISIACVGWGSVSQAQTATVQGQRERTGAELYRSACVSCHGPDGKGAPRGTVGFDTPLPDFSDCSFTTPEPNRDWESTIHLGGPARAFSRRMPAFGDALSDLEIEKIIEYVRGFCTDRRWPRGDLNAPRPLITEKAFPENEAFVVTTVTPSDPARIETRFVYEQRIGARSQFEVVVPFNLQRSAGGWNRGLGDVAVAFKQVVFDSLRSGAIVSAGSELTFPTGKETEFLGRRLTIFEPFGTISQRLPHGGFLHVNVGFEFPLNIGTAGDEFYWRAAVGKTFARGRWGRAWSPMVEVLGFRELAFGEPAFWDLVPEMQVTISRRQHIKINGGVRVPVNARLGRGNTATVYVLWDWFEGGLFSGW